MIVFSSSECSIILTCDDERKPKGVNEALLASFFVLSISLLSHSFAIRCCCICSHGVMITQSVCAICDTREEKRLLSGEKRDIVFGWEKRIISILTTPSFYRHSSVIFYFTTNSMIFLVKFGLLRVKFSSDIIVYVINVQREEKAIEMLKIG